MLEVQYNKQAKSTICSKKTIAKQGCFGAEKSPHLSYIRFPCKIPILGVLAYLNPWSLFNNSYTTSWEAHHLISSSCCVATNIILSVYVPTYLPSYLSNILDWTGLESIYQHLNYWFLLSAL